MNPESEIDRWTAVAGALTFILDGVVANEAAAQPFQLDTRAHNDSDEEGTVILPPNKASVSLESEDEDDLFNSILAGKWGKKEQMALPVEDAVEEEAAESMVSLSRASTKASTIGTILDCSEAHLPPIGRLSIDPKKEIQTKQMGTISSILDALIIIKSLPEAHKSDALDAESILFVIGKEGKRPLGKIYDTFGPVIAPLYSVRFNSPEDIEAINQDVTLIGAPVYAASDDLELSKPIFTERLRQEKWTDVETGQRRIGSPGEEAVEEEPDFSDDEEERLWRANKSRLDQRMEAGSSFGSLNRKRRRGQRGGRGRGAGTPPGRLPGGGQQEPPRDSVDRWLFQSQPFNVNSPGFSANPYPTPDEPPMIEDLRFRRNFNPDGSI